MTWPRDLAPASHPEFVLQARAWLLDRCPPEWRTSPIREDASALAWACSHYISGVQEAMRRAYRESRMEFDDAATLSAVHAALESYGAHLVTVAREVGLVQRALAGRAT